jgi:hypothetical protein
MDKNLVKKLSLMVYDEKVAVLNIEYDECKYYFQGDFLIIERLDKTNKTLIQPIELSKIILITTE